MTRKDVIELLEQVRNLFCDEDADEISEAINFIKDDGAEISDLRRELNSFKILYKPYQPCNHIGCLSHRSHPCEGCGRMAMFILKD